MRRLDWDESARFSRKSKHSARAFAAAIWGKAVEILHGTLSLFKPTWLFFA